MKKSIESIEKKREKERENHIQTHKVNNTEFIVLFK